MLIAYLLNKHGTVVGFSNLNFTNEFLNAFEKETNDFQTQVVLTHLSEKKSAEKIGMERKQTDKHR